MIQKIKALLDKVLDAAFYGSITLLFKQGKLVGIDVQRHIKPDEIQ
jgi:hypothetical protein